MLKKLFVSCLLAGGGSAVWWELGCGAEGSQIEPQCSQNMEGLLVFWGKVPEHL